MSVLDVAKRAGVSSATVSRVLGGQVPVAAETRARVLAAVAQLGYQPNTAARSLRSGRGHAVALVTGDVEQGVYAALAKQVQSELEAIGLDLLLFNLGHREDRLHHLLGRAPSLGLRGLLLASPHVMDMAELLPLIEAARQHGIEMLSLSQDLTAFGVRSVGHDDAGGAAAAVAHLVARDRQAIAFVGRIETSATGRVRFEGYRDGLVAHGRVPDPALVWHISQGYRSEAGYRATADALARGLAFDALVAASDELALGAIAALADAGRVVPDDVAVIGFGGLEWGAFCRPALTSVSLDVDGIAQAVGRMFDAAHSDSAPDRQRLIPTKLLVRQSA
jgi:DNA-binding LacI/PurR family transcriptional regulator